MPRLKENQLPSYRLRKQSGQAVVTLSGDVREPTDREVLQSSFAKRPLADCAIEIDEQIDSLAMVMIRDGFQMRSEWWRRQTAEGAPASCRTNRRAFDFSCTRSLQVFVD
jgi:hypothetical protein